MGVAITIDPFQVVYTLPETDIAPENGWLEDDPFLLEKAYFQGLLLLVSGRVYLQYS